MLLRGVLHLLHPFASLSTALQGKIPPGQGLVKPLDMYSTVIYPSVDVWSNDIGDQGYAIYLNFLTFIVCYRSKAALATA